MKNMKKRKLIKIVHKSTKKQRIKGGESEPIRPAQRERFNGTKNSKMLSQLLFAKQLK